MANDDSWGHWAFAGSEPGPDLNIFSARYDTFIHPVTGKPLRETILETAQWVNVVARTASGDFVLVRQFRFGAREVTLEVPAGLVDTGEEPQAAAERELREETGFVSDAWSDLGAVYPDAGEHLQSLVLSAADVAAAVRDGRIRNPYTVVALSRVLDLRA